MALPRWLARFNRRYLNPRAIDKGSWPVLIHTGRRSGRTYRTPLDAYPIDGGYLFTINYGPKSDWPRNALAAGSASLVVNGRTVGLDNPRLLEVSQAYRLLPADAKTPPALVGVERCLVMATVAA